MTKRDRVTRVTLAVEHESGIVRHYTVVDGPDGPLEVDLKLSRPPLENVGASWAAGYRIHEPGPVFTVQATVAGAPSEDHL